MTISCRNSLAACPHWRTCPIPGSLLMCYSGSFPASHGDWGTIPDGTSAACGTVHSLPVWPLSRQYLPLMKLEQGACVWHHQSLLILLKVNGYLPARVPARRASFPKGQQSPAVSFSTDAVCSMNRVCTVNRTHTQFIVGLEQVPDAPQTMSAGHGLTLPPSFVESQPCL